MSWAIKLPFRSREDSLSEVVEAARVLPTDEARVVRSLVLGEITGGQARTAGELIDRLEAATVEERRDMLDAARERAGLKTTRRLDFEQRHRQRQRNAMARAADSPPPRLALAESGGIIDLAEIELERQREEAKEASLRRAREEREAERAVEAEEARRFEEACREALRRESPQLRGSGA